MDMVKVQAMALARTEITHIKLKKHITAQDVENIKGHGVDVCQIDNNLFAKCHNDADIKTVRQVNDVMNNYYGGDS